MLQPRHAINPLVCSLALLTLPVVNTHACEPEIKVQAVEGWFETTYVILLNREAAIRFQEAVERVDPVLIGGALTASAPHPALKVAVALVTNNTAAFRRALNKQGAIGPHGITITLTAYGGWVAKNLTHVHGPVIIPYANEAASVLMDSGQIALNPWSWTLSPRE